MPYKLFRAALEEHSELPQPEEGEEIVSFTEELELQSEADDAKDSAVEQEAEGIHRSLDEMDNLKQIEDIIEGRVESEEGLSEEAAELATVAVEAIYNRLGYVPKGRAFPALEDFSDKRSSLNSSRVALEDIKETLAKARDAIINAIKALVKKLEDWWDGVDFRARAMLGQVKKLEAIVSRIEASDFTADTKSKLSKGLSNSLALDNIKDLGPRIQKVKTAINGYRSTLNDVADFVEGKTDQLTIKNPQSFELLDSKTLETSVSDGIVIKPDVPRAKDRELDFLTTDEMKAYLAEVRTIIEAIKNSSKIGRKANDLRNKLWGLARKGLLEDKEAQKATREKIRLIELSTLTVPALIRKQAALVLRAVSESASLYKSSTYWEQQLSKK